MICALLCSSVVCAVRVIAVPLRVARWAWRKAIALLCLGCKIACFPCRMMHVGMKYAVPGYSAAVIAAQAAWACMTKQAARVCSLVSRALCCPLWRRLYRRADKKSKGHKKKGKRKHGKRGNKQKRGRKADEAMELGRA